MTDRLHYAVLSLHYAGGGGGEVKLSTKHECYALLSL